MSDMIHQTQMISITIEELEGMIQNAIQAELQAVWEYIFALEEQLPDPDAGKSLKPSVEAELVRWSQERLHHGMGKSWEAVKQDLEER